MLDVDDDAPMKLADWGFATFVHPGKKLSSIAGTCYYIAPVGRARKRGWGCSLCTASGAASAATHN